MSVGETPQRPDFPCPYLPAYEGVLTAGSMSRFRVDRGAGFYRAALAYAQSHWMAGKPAQAILQINKALSADLAVGEPVLSDYPPPYRALVWILEQDHLDRFLGNPVRHFQHLATRMCGPRAEVRTWRAWACFHLSEKCLDADGFPRDEFQIQAEGLSIPSISATLAALGEIGWSGECEIVAGLFGE